MNFFLYFLMVVAFPDLAPAKSCRGGECGGGGNAVVCRNAKGKITSAQLLDLYEGEKAEKLNYRMLPVKSVKEELARAVQNFKSAAGADNDAAKYQAQPYWYWQDSPRLGTSSVMTYFNEFDRRFVVQEGAGLPPLDDSNPEVVPKKRRCATERLALYLDGKIRIDGEIWKKLDNRNKAALIFHEASYRYDRLLKQAEDSTAARRVVRRVFARQPLKSVTQGHSGESPRCTFAGEEVVKGSNTAFTEFFVNQADGKITLSFVALQSRGLYSRTAVEFSEDEINPNGAMGRVQDSWRNLPPMRIQTAHNSKKIELWVQGDENWPEAKIPLVEGGTSPRCFPKFTLKENGKPGAPDPAADAGEEASPGSGDAI